MLKSNDTFDFSSMNTSSIQSQRNIWRRQGWTIPDLRGGKLAWFSLVENLVELIGSGQASDLDARPDTSLLPNPYPWRSYAPFLKGIGLVTNREGVLYLSDEGNKFRMQPDKRHMAKLIQSRLRLFGEVLYILSHAPSTVDEVNKLICMLYGLSWSNLSNIRKRMDWLEVLELIESVGNRKWKPTDMGKVTIKDWCLVTPNALDCQSYDFENAEIINPPVEIANLLQELYDSPEKQNMRSTYNIWVPSPNMIDNLRVIIQVATERISKEDLFHFIENEFGLKKSSVESMLPFLKASGLLEEVGRRLYSATSVANEWLETGNDLDLIRILHAKMQYVGEMIRAAENGIRRNDLYKQAESYGLNKEKVRWRASFLREAGLLEESQYLYLKATQTGMRFAANLPIVSKLDKESLIKTALPNEEDKPIITDIDVIVNKLHIASRDPNAEGLAPGVAFEEAIARVFRYMGFDAVRIGGSGDTDVIVKWQDEDGKRLTAIVDGKSKSSGQVSHNDINSIAIDMHKDKNKADYIGIVGPEFTGDTIRKYAQKGAYALITDARLSYVAHVFETIGLRTQDVGLIFHVPDGIEQLDELIDSTQRQLVIISLVISTFHEEQKVNKSLSPRDLFFILRNSNVSPKLTELLNASSLLSQPEIGVLHATNKTRDPENITYVLVDAKAKANRLRALATAIDKM